MATPYTPKYPETPHPTPASQSLPRRVPRAPVYNPYDKFSQPEFDVWIGGLTGALKRALGRDEPEDRSVRVQDPVDRDEEVAEDSFAEIKARRSAKGKERATSIGNEEQPIVIGSDSEEDGEEEDVHERWGEEFGGEEYEDEDRSQESAEEGSDVEEEHQSSAGEVIELLSDDEEDEREARELAVPSEQEVRLDDEDVECENGSDVSEAGSDEVFQATIQELESKLDEGRSDEDGVEEVDINIGIVEEDENQGHTHEVEDFPSGESEAPVDLSDPWAGPSTYAEDFYSGGDVIPDSHGKHNPHILPTEDVVEVEGPTNRGVGEGEGSTEGDVVEGPAVQYDELDAIDPSLVDTAQPLELPDPWSGPRTFAEDFYAGGELRESDLRTRLPSPSHLTMQEDEVAMFLTPETLTPDVVRTPEEEEEKEDVELPSTEAVPEPSLERGAQGMSPTPEVDDSKEVTLMEELYADYGGEAQDEVSFELTEEDSREDQLLPHQGTAHDDSGSPPPPALNTHVDWNWPPAFAAGRLATRPGHLQSADGNDDSLEEIVEISDDEAEESPILQETGSTGTLEVKETPEHGEDEDASEILATAAQADVGEDANTLAVSSPEDRITEEVDMFAMPADDEKISPEDVVNLYADLDSLMTAEEHQLLGEVAGGDDLAQPVSSQPVADDGVFFSEFVAAHSESVEPSATSAVDVQVSSNVLAEKTEVPDVSVSVKGAQMEFESAPTISPSVEHAEAIDLREPFTDFTQDVVMEADEQDVSMQHDNVVSVATGVTTCIRDEVSEDVVEYEVEEPITEERGTVESETREFSRELSISTMLEGVVDDPDTSLQIIDEYVVIEPEGQVEEIAVRFDVEKGDSNGDYISEIMVENPDADVAPDGHFDQEMTVLSPTPEGVNRSPNAQLTAEEEVSAEIIPSAPPTVSAPTMIEVLDDHEATTQESVQHDSLALSESTHKVQRREAPADVPSEASKSEYMLENGVPMPISADPLVPDPTSVSHTPISPPSPGGIDAALAALPESETVTDRPQSDTRSRDSSVASSSSSRSRSVSGLFTPLTADNSLPVTPKLRNVDLGEDAYVESPLKHVITSEHLTAADGEIDASANEAEVPLAHGEGQQSDHLQPATTWAVDAVAELLAVQEPATATVAVDSSSTNMSKEMDAAANIESLELTYPSDSESAEHSSSQNVAEDHATFVHANETMGDTDAEGDVDPDYMVDHDLSASTNPELAPSILAGVEDTNTLKWTGTDSTIVSQSADKDAVDSIYEIGRSAVGVQALIHSVTAVDHSSVSHRDDGSPLTVTELPSSGTAASDQDETPNNLEQLRPMKRKRVSPALPPPVTRSMTVKEVKNEAEGSTEIKPALSKGKGRQEDDKEDELEDSSLVAASNVGESISAAFREGDGSSMPSRSSSRGSSVVSTAPSIDSLMVPASPTVRRTAASHSHIRPPPSDVDSFGVIRHHHGHPVLQVQVPTERRRETSPSLPAPPPKSEPAESGPSQPPRPSRHLPSSPVTRSNCRYHKISLPREDNGHRIYFVVPGCSLGDRELMKEERIEDHGLATNDTCTHLVSDVEGLDFSPYLLGILRQLVGVDLLREQEIFYLPQPGEQYRFKSKHRARVGKAKLSGNPRKSIRSHNLSRAGSSGPSADQDIENLPSSRAGSVSTAGSGRHQSRLSERSSIATTASVMGSDLSELSDEEEPSRKRRKDELDDTPMVEIEAENEESVSKASIVVARRFAPRRSKRLSVDVHAYKPEENEAGQSTDEDKALTNRRRSKRGVKRHRPDELADVQMDVVRGAPKKRRLRERTAGDKADKEDEK